MIHPTTINEFKAALDARSDRCIFIDVRTPAEYRSVHIEGVKNIPIDTLDQHLHELKKYEKVFVHCKSGSRTNQACKKLDSSIQNLMSMEGGIDKWTKEGLPVVRGKQSLSLMRQVQISSGILIVAGVILGFAMHEGWFLLSGFVGVGLLFAGCTGTCGMATLLSKMPWNR